MKANFFKWHACPEKKGKTKYFHLYKTLYYIWKLYNLYILHNVVVVLLSHVWLFCHPMDCSLTGSSVHGVSQGSILEWAAISFHMGFSQLRGQTHVSCIAGWFFTSELPGKSILYNIYIYNIYIYIYKNITWWSLIKIQYLKMANQKFLLPQTIPQTISIQFWNNVCYFLTKALI